MEDNNKRIVISTKNSIEKYLRFLDCCQDIIEYFSIKIKNDFELFDKILSNAYLGESMNIKQYLEDNRDEEMEQIVNLSITKIDKSTILAKKKLLRNLKTKMKDLKYCNLESLQIKFNKFQEKEQEIID